MSEIEELRGQKLKCVQSVEDYVALVFDRSVLNVYVNPRLSFEGQFFILSKENFDMLQKVIGATVKVSEEIDECIRVVFSTHDVLTIPLMSEVRSGPEAAWYYEPKGSLSRVW